jgi:hypothetical protein
MTLPSDAYDYREASSKPFVVEYERGERGSGDWNPETWHRTFSEAWARIKGQRPSPDENYRVSNLDTNEVWPWDKNRPADKPELDFSPEGIRKWTMPKAETTDWRSMTAEQLGDIARHGRSSSLRNTAILHLVQRASHRDPR